MTKPITLIFAGTADIGVPLLQALSRDARFAIPLVLSAPDRPAGRKLSLTPSPIKAAADALNLSVFTPTSINDPDALKILKNHQPDIILVIAYGQLFKTDALKAPALGCLNVHASLLPKYRGASPIQAALLSGDAETGISLMKMETGLDSGPIYTTHSLSITADDTRSALTRKLAKLAAQTIPDDLTRVASGDIIATPQEAKKATHCPKIQKSDGQIDWHKPADVLAREIRAYEGWPGSFTLFKGRRLKILDAQPFSKVKPPSSGHIFIWEGHVMAGTGSGSLELITLQPEGGRPMPASEFIKGNSDFINSKLD